MAQGFSSSGDLGKIGAIQSLGKSYFLRNLDLLCLRDEWNRDYSRALLGYSSEERLFTPHEYSHQLSNQSACYCERITLGFWNISIFRNPRRKSRMCQEWNFSLSVSCGNSFAFHPLQAQWSIMLHHNARIFTKWKQIVLGDLDRFSHLLAAYNPPNHIYSPTCSVSSENACKKAGLQVKSGIAYLLKSKERECKHKDGTYSPLPWQYPV